MYTKVLTACLVLLAIVAVAVAQNTTAAAAGNGTTKAATNAPTTASGTGFVHAELAMLLLSAVAAFFR